MESKVSKRTLSVRIGKLVLIRYTVTYRTASKKQASHPTKTAGLKTGL
jgi:ribosomal protein L4